MKKNVDSKGRFRGVTIAFRMSKEESELLNKKVRLSGLTKQDYLIKRSLEKEIQVFANPKIYKAVKVEVKEILAELEKIEQPNDELIEIIRVISIMIKTGLENKNPYPKG